MSRFFFCYFETTRRCNLDCPYCMTKRRNESFAGELSTDEAKHLVIDEVKKYSPKSAIAFSGGEFLLRPDAMELLAHNASLDQWSFINTNGEAIDETLLTDIREATNEKVTLVFSLDAVTKRDDVLTRDGAIEQLEEKTRLCQSKDVPYFYVVTISRSNMDDLRDILEFATRDNRPVLRSPFVPRGGGDAHRSLMFDRCEMRDTIHPALRESPLSYISYVPFVAAPKIYQRHWLKSKIAIKHLGCQAGRSYVGVSAEGDVAPCVHLLDGDAVCGNVRTTPLRDILEKSPLLTELRARKTLKGRCGRCRYVQSCGGCRALAYYTHGDVLAEDPTCFIDELTEAERKGIEDVQNVNLATFADFILSNPPWNEIF